MPTHRVYLTHSYRNPADLAALSADELAAAVHLSPFDMDGTDGWVRVGDADVTITLHPMSQVTANAVAALRQELQNVRAEAQMKATLLEGEIAKLLAITCDAEAA